MPPPPPPLKLPAVLPRSHATALERPLTVAEGLLSQRTGTAVMMGVAWTVLLAIAWWPWLHHPTLVAAATLASVMGSWQFLAWVRQRQVARAMQRAQINERFMPSLMKRLSETCEGWTFLDEKDRPVEPMQVLMPFTSAFEGLIRLADARASNRQRERMGHLRFVRVKDPEEDLELNYPIQWDAHAYASTWATAVAAVLPILALPERHQCVSVVNLRQHARLLRPRWLPEILCTADDQHRLLGYDDAQCSRILTTGDDPALTTRVSPVMFVSPAQPRVQVAAPVATPDRFQSKHQPLVDVLTQDLPLAMWPAPEAWASFRAEFPWAAEAMDRLETLMAFSQTMGDGRFRLPPLLFLGQPGCGKTRLAQRLGDVLGFPNLTLSAAGTSGGQLVMGVERHWGNGSPSPLLTFMQQHRTANPLIIVDEIDKAATHREAGSFQEALLPLLEPESARRFMDPYLLMACDLSHLNWVLTANLETAIHGPLKSRLEVIPVGHPQPEHLPVLAQTAGRELAQTWAFAPETLPAWEAADSQWVLKRLGSALFTAREARRWLDQRWMDKLMGKTGPKLVLVPPTARN